MNAETFRLPCSAPLPVCVASVARNGPPVALGFGEGEFCITSDVAAVLDHSREVLFLADGEVATVTRTGLC
jgi:glucosamine 6-phosphate synthetase-like amidotransferase/phosphosugar isomerase protein